MTAERILLLQARDAGDPMLEHELQCFAEMCSLPTEAFRTLNLASEAIAADVLDGVDVVMVGGSGDYSLVKGGFDWHERYLEFVRDIVRRDFPTFASCFGFQALIQALGGQIVRDDDWAEVGTHEITLTEAGQNDPLFGTLPPVFDAQLGHNDSALTLPQELECLARSERCPVQAVRVRGRHIVATQFHPELDRENNGVRYMRYLHAYAPNLTDEQARIRAAELHRPSPHANALLRRFLDSL